MELALAFARLLLEADQHAQADRLQEALALYRRMGELPQLDAAEEQLVLARLQRIDAALATLEEIEDVDLISEPEEEAPQVVSPQVAPPQVAPAAAAEQVAAAVRQAVVAAVADWRDGLPEDPIEMLQALLARIQSNRRTAV